MTAGASGCTGAFARAAANRCVCRDRLEPSSDTCSVFRISAARGSATLHPPWMTVTPVAELQPAEGTVVQRRSEKEQQAAQGIRTHRIDAVAACSIGSARNRWHWGQETFWLHEWPPPESEIVIPRDSAGIATARSCTENTPERAGIMGRHLLATTGAGQIESAKKQLFLR